MMKITLIFLLLSFNICFSQKVYVYNEQASPLYEIDLQTCEEKEYDFGFDQLNIFYNNFTDKNYYYNVHPDGSLYCFITMHSRVVVTKLDLITSTYEIITTITGPLSLSWSVFNIDYQGDVYATMPNSENNFSVDSITVFSDPLLRDGNLIPWEFPDPTFTGSRYNYSFIREKLFYYSSDLFLVDDVSGGNYSYEIIDFPYLVFGVQPIAENCKNEYYFFHTKDLKEEFNEYDVSTYSFDTIQISNYNLEDSSYSTFCEFIYAGLNDSNTPADSPFKGAVTSFYQYLYSDPECELLIDLDRNNSSGKLPYDYENSDPYCTHNILPICDEDAYVYTSEPLDSITFILDNAYPTSGLSYVGNNFDFIDRENYFALIARADSDRSDESFAQGLIDIRYDHNEIVIDSINIAILVQGHSPIKSGDSVYAFLPLAPVPHAGNDISLTVCADEQIINLLDSIGGLTGGTWSEIFSIDNAYDPQVDQWSSIDYRISSDYCGSDTATVMIDVLDLPQNYDQSIKACPGGQAETSLALADGETILWSDGSTQLDRMLPIGEHLFMITNELGCSSQSTITVEEDPDLMIMVQDTITLCEDEVYTFYGTAYAPGQSINATLDGGTSCDTSLLRYIQGVAPSMIEEELFICAGDSILLDGDYYTPTEEAFFSVAGPYCDSLFSYTIRSYESINYNLPDALHITQDTTVTLDYDIISSSSPTHFNGQELFIPFSDSPYTVTIIIDEESGCNHLHDIEILPIKEDPLPDFSLPNIISKNPFLPDNGIFYLQSSEYIPYELSIYDRWGNLIYDISSITNIKEDAWKAEDAQPGVYVYRIHIGEEKLFGTLTVIE